MKRKLSHDDQDPKQDKKSHLVCTFEQSLRKELFSNDAVHQLVERLIASTDGPLTLDRMTQFQDIAIRIFTSSTSSRDSNENVAILRRVFDSTLPERERQELKRGLEIFQKDAGFLRFIKCRFSWVYRAWEGTMKKILSVAWKLVPIERIVMEWYIECGHRSAEQEFEEFHYWLNVHGLNTPHIVKLILFLHWSRVFIERRLRSVQPCFPMHRYWCEKTAIAAVLQLTALNTKEKPPSQVNWLSPTSNIETVLDLVPWGGLSKRQITRQEQYNEKSTAWAIFLPKLYETIHDACWCLPTCLCALVLEFANSIDDFDL